MDNNTDRVARALANATSPTARHNLEHLQRFISQQATASRTGGTCPKCGEGANPTIVANFGHCLKCQSAAFGR
jgi:hypothetical protein